MFKGFLIIFNSVKNIKKKINLKEFFIFAPS